MDANDESKAPVAKTGVERFVARLRANPVVATLIVVAAIVAGIASFTDSATKLLALFAKPSPTAARASLGRMGLPFDADHFVTSAGNGDLTAVKLFATAGMDLDASAADGSTALASAAFHDRLPVMTFLLDAGAHISADGGANGSAGGSERSALYSAVAGGHDDALRLLLARKPDAATIDAAFIVAVGRRLSTPPRNLEAMHTLAASGADVRRVAPAAFAAVWQNADDEDAAEATRALLELGVVLADLEGTGGEARTQTPLMKAAAQGFATTADVLLEAGARVDTRYRHPDSDDDGATALMLAAGSGSTAIVRALLAKGASADTRDRRGLRAIDYAKRGSLMNRADVVRVLAAAK
ncbi:MAG: ankyrin repeat domain-containing protein [Burkholderiaceae bacterium]